MADEKEILNLLETARHEHWRDLHLRKKALIFTGCPTSEQLTQLKRFKADWKEFLDSLDPSIKNIVQKYEKQRGRDIKAKSKAKVSSTYIHVIDHAYTCRCPDPQQCWHCTRFRASDLARTRYLVFTLVSVCLKLFISILDYFKAKTEASAKTQAEKVQWQNGNTDSC